MHIVIFGVGAIGGFYGTVIAKHIQKTLKTDRISFVARGETFGAIQKDGLYLRTTPVIFNETQTSPLKDELIHLTGISVYKGYQAVPLRTDEQTMVMLCVKSKDTKACAQEIQKRLTDQTLVISVQNGVENEEKLAEILGTKHVIGCLTNIAAEVVKPGSYTQKGNHGLLLGELTEEAKASGRLNDFVKLAEAAGIKVTVVPDIQAALWSKLVWNAGFNPLSALHELELGPLMDKHEELIRNIMRETKEVALAQGIQVPVDIDRSQFDRTKIPEWRNFKTSMLQDKLRNRPLEIDDLLGVVVRQGKKFGVATPCAEAVFNRLAAQTV
jgi:2-dehydropantoate 2-reductase